MLYNDTISIFDSIELDGDIKIIQYIISKCYLEMSFGSSIVIDGERKNYNATLFIPEDFISSEKYIKPKKWNNLSLDEKMNYFTIRPNQVIAKLNEYKQYNSLDDVLNSEDDSFRVIGVEYLDKVLPHFEVICK